MIENTVDDNYRKWMCSNHLKESIEVTTSSGKASTNNEIEKENVSEVV